MNVTDFHGSSNDAFFVPSDFLSQIWPATTSSGTMTDYVPDYGLCQLEDASHKKHNFPVTKGM